MCSTFGTRRLTAGSPCGNEGNILRYQSEWTVIDADGSTTMLTAPFICVDTASKFPNVWEFAIICSIFNVHM